MSSWLRSMKRASADRGRRSHSTCAAGLVATDPYGLSWRACLHRNRREKLRRICRPQRGIQVTGTVEGAFTLEPMATLDDISARERDMLMRYCARFTGDPLVAEDLAQQTLFEAWQKSHTLHNRQVRGDWLLGMARNVC